MHVYECQVQVERIRANLQTLDPSLGPYPYSCYQQWVSLSSNITAGTLRRLNPTGKLALITSQVELETKEQQIERQMVGWLGEVRVDYHLYMAGIFRATASARR